MKIKLKKGDIGLIIFLILIFIFLVSYGYFKSNKSYNNVRIVIMTRDKKIIKKFCDKPEKIKINGRRGVSVVLIGSNWVRMIDSSCPNKLCVKQGKIYKIGQQIICLPNEVSIKIESINNSYNGVDSICH